MSSKWLKSACFPAIVYAVRQGSLVWRVVALAVTVAAVGVSTVGLAGASGTHWPSWRLYLENARGQPVVPGPFFEADFGGPYSIGNIRNLEEYMFEGAASGSLLQLSIYQINQIEFAKELVNSAQRGVHVQVLLDGGNSTVGCRHKPGCVNPAFIELQKLNTLNETDPETWMRTCTGIGPQNPDHPTDTGNGCIGHDLNHNKLLLATDIPYLNHQDATDVVFQSSANNTHSQAHHALNDAVIIAERPTVYNDYERYFNQLVAASTSTSSPRFTPTTGTSIDTTTIEDHDIATWSFPRAPSDDPVADALDHIRTAKHCANPSGGAHGPAHTHIDAAISDIKGRPLLMRKLVALRAAGCRVRIVYATMAARDRALLKNADVGLHEVCTAPDPNDPVPATDYVHSKFLLVNGSDRVLGKNIRIVYTGSENWTNKSLSAADNRMMRYVETAAVAVRHPKYSSMYVEYADDFQQLVRVSKGNKQKPHGCAAATA
jgi:phosphatidylserine/phosphatidylglycerophosphate/cardiolipin synthase-like enzyme